MIWNQALIEATVPHLKKGSRVRVVGSLEHRSYEADHGDVICPRGHALSNRIRAVISHPRFSDAAFPVGDEDAHMTLRIKY